MATISLTPDLLLPKTGVALAGVRNGINRAFTTPDKFVHVSGGATIAVLHNGRRLTQAPAAFPFPHFGEFFVSESGGSGTGFDTINFLAFVPGGLSELRADYYLAT